MPQFVQLRLRQCWQVILLSCNKQAMRYCYTLVSSTDKFRHNKAIADITLRPRCAIPLPPSRPLGCTASTHTFSEYTICNCLAYRMIPSAACHYWRLNDSCSNERDSNAAAMAAAKVANVLECPNNPQKWPLLLLGICAHI